MRYLVFFLVVLANLNAQTYKFDHVLSYEIEINGGKHIYTRYVNSQNFNYVMSVSPFFSGRDQITIIIHDLITKKNHFFIAHTKGNDDMATLEFKHHRTVQSPDNKIDENMSYELSSDDNDPTIVNLKLYKNAKKKTILANAEMKVSDYPINLLPTFTFFNGESPLSYLRISTNRSFIVDTATERLKNGWMVKYTRKYVNPIDLTISLPK